MSSFDLNFIHLIVEYLVGCDGVSSALDESRIYSDGILLTTYLGRYLLKLV